VHDHRIQRILGGVGLFPPLISAAFASSTWDKITSALNTLEKFSASKNVLLTWPVPSVIVSGFIHWAALEQKLTPNTIVSYMSHIKLIHKLRSLDYSACSDANCRYLIRGAKNLVFYSPVQKQNKKTMTLPLLRIFGHELAKTNWSTLSKSVVWSAVLTGFFGSFRMGELLPKYADSFNIHETLLWSDVKFFADGSLQIHNKIPKNRTEGGEFISLFKFSHHHCCPIEAISNLKSLSAANPNTALPVFAFENGRFLTCALLNKIMLRFFKPHLGIEAHLYTCRSFRSALQSVLATLPANGNEKFIKRWGRWNSKAFERYIRLSHLAKEKIFKKFVKALTLEHNP